MCGSDVLGDVLAIVGGGASGLVFGWLAVDAWCWCWSALVGAERD